MLSPAGKLLGTNFVQAADPSSPPGRGYHDGGPLEDVHAVSARKTPSRTGERTSISVLVPNTASRKSTCRLYVRSSPTCALFRACCLRTCKPGVEL